MGENMKTETVYQIPAENIGTVRARIEALQKRAARICKKFALTDDTAISITVGEPWVRVTRRDLVSEEVRTVLYPVTVTGAAPRIAGWDFVAVLEHTVAGNLLKQVPGTELPEATLTAYRAAPSLCDHCTTRRRRTETFLVRSEAGELKQIGRNCLADYLGHEDPEAIIEAAQFLADCGAFFGDEEGWGSGGSADVQAIEDFLPWVAMAIRDSGWTPKSKAQPEIGKFSTVAVANSLAAEAQEIARSRSNRTPKYPSTADRDLAKAAIEWCRTELANKPSKSDYEHNLVVICSIDVLRAKNEGIAASLIPTYQRATAQKIERAKRPTSEHVGEVGKRLTFTATLERVFSFDSDYGAIHIHKFRTAEGSILVWKTGSAMLNQGKVYTIKGTVKTHDEYKGEKQTTLSRCVATPVESAEIAA
jgi:hypothetical protein